MRVLGHKPSKGQVWRRKKDRRNNEQHLVLLTKGGDTPKGKRLDKPHIQHHFLRKTLWLFYELIGTEGNYPDNWMLAPALEYVPKKKGRR